MEAQKNRLIETPQEENFALTPQIWLALGVIAYNHLLLTKTPARILALPQLPPMPPARAEAITRGLAVAVDTKETNPAARAAIIRITRELMQPLGITVALHGGQGGSPPYILMQYHGGLDLALPELPEPPATIPPQRIPA